MADLVLITAQDAVITALTALASAGQGTDGGLDPSVDVSDGPSTSNNPGQRLIIGADGPDDDPATTTYQAATSSADWAHSTGTQRAEEGDVYCTAMAWNANNSAAQARADVMAIASAVAGICVSDYTLGGLPNLLWALPGGRVSLTYLQVDDGLTAVLVFGIHFKARI